MVKPYVRMLLFVFLISGTQVFSQETSIQSWRSQMGTYGLGFDVIYQACPHFPNIDSYKEDAAFIGALQKWQKAYPFEEKAFWNLEQIKRVNPSPYYLGLSDGSVPDAFQSSIWEWVHNSGIADERMNEVAAHFPKPALTGNAKEDTKTYEAKLDYWVKLYPVEYEHLLNAKELVASNPFYTGYFKPVIIPAFIAAPLHETKPYREAYSNTAKGELSYELSIRAWYFVFEPQTFDRLYGADYKFPEWFSVEKFRADVKQKFEWNKNTPAEIKASHPGR